MGPTESRLKVTIRRLNANTRFPDPVAEACKLACQVVDIEKNILNGG